MKMSPDVHDSVCFSHKIPGYLQILSRSKGHYPGYSADNICTKRHLHQRHSKFAAVQNLEKIVAI